MWIAAAALPALAQSAQSSVGSKAEAGLPRVTDVRVLSTPDRARLVVDLTAPTEFAIASLAKPDRIVVDIRADGVTRSIATELAGKGLIKSYSLAEAEPGRARAELKLNVPAQVQQAYVLEPLDDQPARLVVDFIPDTDKRFAQRVEDDLAAAKARAAKNDAARLTPEQTAPTPPGGTNLPVTARPLIVIDPGHGGVDGGASAPSGLREKEVTLDFALELQRVLVASGRFDVALTRDGDKFVRLEQRVALARENKADLFLSIHADTFADPDIRGASLYTLDEEATDSLDKVLADNENRADLVAGFVPAQPDDKVVDILVDLMRRETRRQSFSAARAIEQQLEPSVRLRRFPLRRANFFVLQAPEVPSILIELGFLSNDTDTQNLEKKAWRDRTAEAVARGVSAYFDALRRP